MFLILLFFPTLKLKDLLFINHQFFLDLGLDLEKECFFTFQNKKIFITPLMKKVLSSALIQQAIHIYFVEENLLYLASSFRNKRGEPSNKDSFYVFFFHALAKLESSEALDGSRELDKVEILGELGQLEALDPSHDKKITLTSFQFFWLRNFLTFGDVYHHQKILGLNAVRISRQLKLYGLTKDKNSTVNKNYKIFVSEVELLDYLLEDLFYGYSF